jgi:hypothetical protein
MSVYVDDMGAPYRGMIMFHMIADSSEELIAMADRIGVARKWIQHPYTYKEHFDICAAKRKLAVSAGAIQIKWRDYAVMVRARQGGK